MLKFTSRALFAAGIIVLFLGLALSPCFAAPSQPTPPAPSQPKPTAAEQVEKGIGTPQKPAGAGAGETPTAGSTAGPTAQPTVDPTKVAENCVKAVTKLGAGDAKAFQTLPAEKVKALGTTSVALHALTCLAIAAGDKSYCNALDDQGKSRCLDQLKMVGELKALPKERVKANLLNRLCLRDGSKADCDRLLEAIAAKDAAKCQGFSNAGFGDFCAAIASGDATKCKALPEGEERGRCEAYATDDPSRCAKDSVDCRNMAGTFAKVQKEGLAGLESIDPGAAAAIKGKSACTPLLSDLQGACVDSK